MSCADGTVLVEWAAGRGTVLLAETPTHGQALAIFHASPLAPLLAPVRGWDLDAPERAHLGGELAAWPLPSGWTAPVQPRAFPGRARVAVAPLRQQGVAGDLAAALAELPGRAERRRLARVASEERARALGAQPAVATSCPS